MDYISQANVGGTTYAVGLPNMYINDKGNFNIETSAEIGNTSKGKINIESMDDIQIKPGDDIILYSHHRAEDKQDEVAVKVTDGDDVPVKLQLNASEILLTTKDKTGDNANVMDVTVNSGKNARGYLKVRAQAIDLRSESHGGIALQPKGRDDDGYMNKIKFEHGGGDGLEFGTFNTEHSSLFTEDYRFNKDGVIKLANRFSVDSDKQDPSDDTTDSKYIKNNTENNQAMSQDSGKTYDSADDFYDFVESTDPTCTWKDVVTTANALNNEGAGVKSTLTESEGLTISNRGYYKCVEEVSDLSHAYDVTVPTNTSFVVGEKYPIEYWIDKLDVQYVNTLDEDKSNSYETISVHKPQLYVAVGSMVEQESIDSYEEVFVPQAIYHFTYFGETTIHTDGKLQLSGQKEIKMDGSNIDFGSVFAFGETDGGIQTQYKRTSKNKTKDCGVLNVTAVNNSSSAYTFPTIWDPSANDGDGAAIAETEVSINPGESQVIAQASLYDIIKLVNHMKTNSLGPWSE